MIKNIGLLNLGASDNIRLMTAAHKHQQMSNIQFEIREANDNMVDVLTTQGYHMSGNYADRDALFQRTLELLKPFTQDKIITCSVTCYEDMASKN